MELTPYTPVLELEPYTPTELELTPRTPGPLPLRPNSPPMLPPSTPSLKSEKGLVPMPTVPTDDSVMTESPIVPMPLLLEPTHLAIRPTVDGLFTKILPVFVIGVGAGLGDGIGVCAYPTLQVNNPNNTKPQMWRFFTCVQIAGAKLRRDRILTLRLCLPGIGSSFVGKAL